METDHARLTASFGKSEFLDAIARKFSTTRRRKTISKAGLVHMEHLRTKQSSRCCTKWLAYEIITVIMQSIHGTRRGNEKQHAKRFNPYNGLSPADCPPAARAFHDARLTTQNASKFVTLVFCQSVVVICQTRLSHYEWQLPIMKKAPLY